MVRERGVGRRRRPIRERDVEAQDVYDYHEERLDEEGGGEVCAEPVEDSLLLVSEVLEAEGVEVLEYTGDQHDEGDVEREACRAPRLVY